MPNLIGMWAYIGCPPKFCGPQHPQFLMPKILGCWRPWPLGWGHGWLLETRPLLTCYHADYGHYKANHLNVCRWICWKVGFHILPFMVTQVIKTDIYWSVTYDFLLVIHVYGPLMYRFQDKGQLRSKSTNFSHPYVLNITLRGYLFRSTSKSRPNNITGGKNVRPSIRPSVHPQKVSSISMKFGI